MPCFFGCQQAGIKQPQCWEVQLFQSWDASLLFSVSSDTAWPLWQSWSRRFNAKNGKRVSTCLLWVWLNPISGKSQAEVLHQNLGKIFPVFKSAFFPQEMGFYVLPAAPVFGLPYFSFEASRFSLWCSLSWGTVPKRQMSHCPTIWEMRIPDRHGSGAWLRWELIFGIGIMCLVMD